MCDARTLLRDIGSHTGKLTTMPENMKFAVVAALVLASVPALGVLEVLFEEPKDRAPCPSAKGERPPVVGDAIVPLPLGMRELNGFGLL